MQTIYSRRNTEGPIPRSWNEIEQSKREMQEVSAHDFQSRCENHVEQSDTPVSFRTPAT
jgi:hypothetical protein